MAGSPERVTSGGLLGGGVVGWVGTWTITLELTNLTVAARIRGSFTVAVAAFKDVLTRAAAGLTEMEESLYDAGAQISLTWLTPDRDLYGHALATHRERPVVHREPERSGDRLANCDCGTGLLLLRLRRLRFQQLGHFRLWQ